jgi:hypothetical protein
MSPRRHLVLAALALAATPIGALAQGSPRDAQMQTQRAQTERVQWTEPAQRAQLQALYRQGWEQGQRAGLEDARRGQPYRFTDEADFRRTDAVLSQRAYTIRHRDEYRRGYSDGYNSGWTSYGRAAGPSGRGGPYYSPRPGWGAPPWSDRSGGRGTARFDLAYQNGLSDGYERGMEDARDRNRFDPISEGRYRDGDRGYEREYGPKDVYKANYRAGFRQGYEEGYVDAQRYGWR